MFGPQHLKYVIAYLDGIDSALSQKMLRKNPPDEPALTNELCAFLDADTQRIEARLEYSVDQLNLDLAALGDGLDFEVTLDTYPHNTAMERYVSQSDFGLVLEYDNRVLPEENWSTAYLVQAKRLFRNVNSREYDQGARFQALNARQSARLDRLSDILGPSALCYALYCPPTSALSEPARTQVRALHTRNLAGKIYDYGPGLALRDALAANGGIDAGIWFHEIDNPPSSLPKLHAQAFHGARPFTWFLVEHFSPVSRLHMRGIEGSRSEGREHERVRRIVTGDREAVRELIDELERAGEDGIAPETITVLPRHTISVRVTVGKALQPDVARVQPG